MAAHSLFWNTNMDAVTWCENALYVKATRAVPGKVRHRVVCRQFNAKLFSFNVNRSLFSTQKIVKFKSTTQRKTLWLLLLDLANKELLMAQRNQHLFEFVLRRKHFLIDVAVVTIDSETVSFLKTLGCAKKGTPAKKVTLKDTKENVDKARSELQRGSKCEGAL